MNTNHEASAEKRWRIESLYDILLCKVNTRKLKRNGIPPKDNETNNHERETFWKNNVSAGGINIIMMQCMQQSTIHPKCNRVPKFGVVKNLFSEFLDFDHIILKNKIKYLSISKISYICSKLGEIWSLKDF